MIHDMLERSFRPTPLEPSFSEEEIRDRKAEIFRMDSDTWEMLELWARGLLSDSEIMERLRVILKYADSMALDSLVDQSREEAGA